MRLRSATFDQRHARGAARAPDVGDGQRLPRAAARRGSLARAVTNGCTCAATTGSACAAGCRRTHGRGLDAGDDEAGDRRRRIGGGESLERFDERLQRAIWRQIERAERTRDHELEPAGHTELTAGFVGSGSSESRSCATRTTGRPPAATGPSMETLPLLERRTTCAEGTPAIWPRTTCSATSRTIVTASYGRSRTPAPPGQPGKLVHWVWASRRRIATTLPSGTAEQ